jgi:hypothetical protein
LNCGFVEPEPSPDGRRVALQSYVEEGGASRLYVARANGSKRRLIGRLAYAFTVPAWAPDSTRLLYTGADGVHLVDANGTLNRLVAGSVAGDDAPAWSPDGRSFAYCRGDVTPASIIVSSGAASRVVAEDAQGGCSGGEFVWSPSGRWLAYTTNSAQVRLVGSDGRGRRTLARSASSPVWSPNGRFLAFDTAGRVEAFDMASRHLIAFGDGQGMLAGWSPDSRTLAVDLPPANVFGADPGTVELFDPRTGALLGRMTEPCAGARIWAPDGRSFVCSAQADATDQPGGASLEIGSFRTPLRTLVAAGGDHGGRITGYVWTRSPAGTRYRTAGSRTLATVSGNQLTTVVSMPIERIAADGDRVAYVSCGHVYVWTPASGSVVQTEAVASAALDCTTSQANFNPYHIYSLALAGDTVAYGAVCCLSSKNWTLLQHSIQPGATTGILGQGGGSLDDGSGHYADPTGSGSLLVFNSWDSTYDSSDHTVTTTETILRAPPAGCPCPALRTDPGPLIIDDVDAGRIVAHGDNAVVVLDSNGKQLLSIPAVATTASLSGNELVVLDRGRLRDYNASTGALTHSWLLPDVANGSDCSPQIGYDCPPPPEPNTPLRLQDAARGLVAYTLDTQLHLLRLADGQVATIGPASHARFMNTGLVYSDGNRLHLIPYDQLPLQ